MSMWRRNNMIAMRRMRVGVITGRWRIVVIILVMMTVMMAVMVTVMVYVAVMVIIVVIVAMMIVTTSSLATLMMRLGSVIGR